MYLVFYLYGNNPSVCSESYCSEFLKDAILHFVSSQYFHAQEVIEKTFLQDSGSYSLCLCGVHSIADSCSANST